MRALCLVLSILLNAYISDKAAICWIRMRCTSSRSSPSISGTSVKRNTSSSAPLPSCRAASTAARSPGKMCSMAVGCCEPCYICILSLQHLEHILYCVGTRWPSSHHGATELRLRQRHIHGEAKSSTASSTNTTLLLCVSVYIPCLSRPHSRAVWVDLEVINLSLYAKSFRRP